MCNCKNIEFGTYQNQTTFNYKNKLIGIDNCIVDEIKRLWFLDIKTLESCCGHIKANGYIAVSEEHIDKMTELDYKRDLTCPDAENRFNIFLIKTK